jgi:hypothetical protein
MRLLNRGARQSNGEVRGFTLRVKCHRWLLSKEAEVKQPPGAGSNRTARPAHAALVLLDDLRQQTGGAIPIAWDPVIGDGAYAIEGYPGVNALAFDSQIVAW